MNEKRLLRRLSHPWPLAAALLMLNIGCSPQVYTRIQKSYPARPADSPVLVYEYTDSLPPAAEVLGNVEVRDNGLSTNCAYAVVLQLAKNETNKAGGNGFILTWHKEPTVFGSSCHQIAGNILLVPDSTYAVSGSDNLAQQYLRTNLMSIPANTALTTAGETADKRKPCVLLLNGGYGFIVSKYYLPEGGSGNPKQGLDINGAFQWVGRSGLGVGLRYSGYFSSIQLDGAKVKIGLHYIGPEFVLRQELGRRKKWAFQESVGLGYAHYKESLGTISGGFGGFGYHVELGAEYKLTPSVGLGASVGAYAARFKSADNLNKAMGYEENAGINRLTVNGGVRFYF